MFRLIFTFSLILIFSGLQSQTIVVKSFRKLETDQDARISFPKMDQNGKKCAIIKVVTSQTGFVFDFGLIGNAVASEQKTGEIWVWVPAGARKVTINHQQLGVLRNYPFEIDIEEATVYEMVLVSGTVTTSVNEVITSQWLVIKSEPAKAMIYLDDQFVKTGEYQAKLKPGIYTYRVEAPLYHTEAGKIEIKDTKKEIQVNLKAAFGFVSITTSPESSASVIIDGKEQSQGTPCKSEPMASGEHTIQVVKVMFQPSTQKVTVSDDQTTPVSFILKPNFAEFKFTSSADAMLFINNQQKGSGVWQGRLNPGVYSLEARKEKYRSAKQDIELVVGDQRTIELQPTPIFGSLDIISSPSGASITIEGKDYGTTPNTIEKLLIGDYVVKLNKTGYASINRNVAISEENSSEINENLVNGRAITINSTPAGTNLYIDGSQVGQTPFTGNLTFGNHKLRIEQGDRKAERPVRIEDTGGEATFTLSFTAQNFTETIDGVNIEMVVVKGGTFQMGNSVGKPDQKPVISVTVNDFYIGKTEITQSQWKTIMGNDPSSFKGNNLPVNRVSWIDVQEFIKKLNLKTGKTYRLPTEAEWEYAASNSLGTDRNIWAGTNSEISLGDHAWYSDNSIITAHAVGTKQPNKLGIYDMSGNVWEWCSDWYSSNSYAYSRLDNPQGVLSGTTRVNRGGGWDSYPFLCRVTFRNSDLPTERKENIGFRLALAP